MPRKPRTAACIAADTRSGRSTRRDFLKGATTIAAGRHRGSRGRGGERRSASHVALGSSRVTRLVAGGNPLYGYSHFNEQYSQHMLEWFTDERVVELPARLREGGDQHLAVQLPRARAATVPAHPGGGLQDPVDLPRRPLGRGPGRSPHARRRSSTAC